MESIKTGIPKGYDKSAKDSISMNNNSNNEVVELKKALEDLKDENSQLKNRIQELELKLEHHEKSKTRNHLADAKLKDSVVNGNDEEEEEEENEN